MIARWVHYLYEQPLINIYLSNNLEIRKTHGNILLIDIYSNNAKGLLNLAMALFNYDEILLFSEWNPFPNGSLKAINHSVKWLRNEIKHSAT